MTPEEYHECGKEFRYWMRENHPSVLDEIVLGSAFKECWLEAFQKGLELGRKDALAEGIDQARKVPLC